MDQGPLQQSQVLAPLSDPEIRQPELPSTVAFDHLCEWFDGQLQILEGRFAAFCTHRSAKMHR